MKIRFLFYKAQQDGKWLDNAISSWTWLLALARCDFKSLKYDFSHAEVWFGDEDYGFYTHLTVAKQTAYPYADAIRQTGIAGQCFSATTRGENKGVRFAPANEVLKHPERWDYIEFEVKDGIIENYMPVFQEKVGLAYDFAGIAGFALPFNPQDKNKWFCSELCAWVAFLFFILHDQHKRISPRRLAKLLVKAGGELKSLT